MSIKQLRVKLKRHYYKKCEFNLALYCIIKCIIGNMISCTILQNGAENEIEVKLGDHLP